MLNQFPLSVINHKRQLIIFRFPSRIFGWYYGSLGGCEELAGSTTQMALIVAPQQEGICVKPPPRLPFWLFRSKDIVGASKAN